MVTVERTKVQITAPAVMPVTIESARDALRADGTDLDIGIQAWLEGAVPQVEHEIGQCLIEQTWEVRQNFLSGRVKLPHPVIAVESFIYIDTSGVERTLTETDYALIGKRYESYLMPAYGKSWPAVRVAPASVRIRVRCGYGSTPDAVPRNVKLYLLARLVEQFDPVTQSDRGGVGSAFLDRLLDSCRSD